MKQPISKREKIVIVTGTLLVILSIAYIAIPETHTLGKAEKDDKAGSIDFI